jgi:hypothetical protein
MVVDAGLRLHAVPEDTETDQIEALFSKAPEHSLRCGKQVALSRILANIVYTVEKDLVSLVIHKAIAFYPDHASFLPV